MEKEIKEELAASLAEDMSISELQMHKKKTVDDAMSNKIDEIISNRTVCPECSNDLMKDEVKNELYCPGCSFCFEV